MGDTRPWPEGFRQAILYVGDESGRRDEIRAALTGWAMQPADDGVEAMALLKHPARPDALVIVLDLAMPVFEGLGFEKARRADPELAGLPVVLVTAHAADERVRKFGARAYVPRPFAAEELVAVVLDIAAQGSPGPQA